MNRWNCSCHFTSVVQKPMSNLCIMACASSPMGDVWDTDIHHKPLPSTASVFAANQDFHSQNQLLTAIGRFEREEMRWDK